MITELLVAVGAITLIKKTNEIISPAIESYNKRYLRFKGDVKNLFGNRKYYCHNCGKEIDFLNHDVCPRCNTELFVPNSMEEKTGEDKDDE